MKIIPGVGLIAAVGAGLFEIRHHDGAWVMIFRRS
jgi:hypothetical protein